jgi:hypothetical protein
MNCDEYDHLLGNGSVNTAWKPKKQRTRVAVHFPGNGLVESVPAANNISKDIPVINGERQLTVRGRGRYSVLPKL